MEEKWRRRAWLLVGLGAWLVATALTFGSTSCAVVTSDLISGCLWILLGLLSLRPKRNWSAWMAAIVGLWLQLAPLVFWAPQAFSYLNDTIVGAVGIAVAFLVVQKESSREDAGPQGWSYNPSAWNHRIPTVALAILCWFFSRYMAAFQLGYIDKIWDPFFLDGTLHVITSKISHDFPVSDAGLGAVCYTMEALLGWQGDKQRWYRMPWLVLAFGLLVVPVGIVSILLIILQPVAVGFWCSWCLATATCMLLMIILTGGELIATLQYLWTSGRTGRGRWKLLWRGGDLERGLMALAPRASAWGITFPWNLFLTILLGVWVILSPSFFHSVGTLAVGDYIAGPLVIAFSVISLAEVFRSLRYLLILLGGALIAVAWVAPDLSHTANWNNAICGACAILLCFPKGKIRERYGWWEKFIF